MKNDSRYRYCMGIRLTSITSLPTSRASQWSSMYLISIIALCKSNFYLSYSDHIFVPALSLAIEYHGEYHYRHVPMYQLDKIIFIVTHNRHDLHTDVRKRDQSKQTICLQEGITLITIPYWWNKTSESVAIAIRNARPDISR